MKHPQIVVSYLRSFAYYIDLRCKEQAKEPRISELVTKLVFAVLMLLSLALWMQQREIEALTDLSVQQALVIQQMVAPRDNRGPLNDS